MPGLRDALADTTVVNRLARLPKAPADQRTVLGAAVIAAAMTEKDRRGFLSVAMTDKDSARLAGDLAGLDPDTLSTPYSRRVLSRALVSREFTFAGYAEYTKLTGDRTARQVARAAIREGLADGPEPDLVLGRDVIPLTSRKPGPWVGKLLDETRDRQYRGEFSDRNAALAWVRDQLLQSEELELAEAKT